MVFPLMVHPDRYSWGTVGQSHLNINLQMSADEETHYPVFMKDVKYANKAALQTVDICLPRPITRHNSSKLWVMYELRSQSLRILINN